MNLIYFFPLVIGMLSAIGTWSLPIGLQNSEVDLETDQLHLDNDADLNASPNARTRRHHRRHHHPEEAPVAPLSPQVDEANLNSGQAYPGNLVYAPSGVSFNIPYMYRPSDIFGNEKVAPPALEEPLSEDGEIEPITPVEVPGQDFLKRVDSIADAMHKFYENKHNENQVFKLNGAMDQWNSLALSQTPPRNHPHDTVNVVKVGDKNNVASVAMHQIKPSVSTPSFVPKGLGTPAASPGASPGVKSNTVARSLANVDGEPSAETRLLHTPMHDNLSDTKRTISFKPNLDSYVKYLGKNHGRPPRSNPPLHSDVPSVGVTNDILDNIVDVPPAYFYQGDSSKPQNIRVPVESNRLRLAKEAVDYGNDLQDSAQQGPLDDYKALPAYILMPPLLCPSSCTCHGNKDHVESVKMAPKQLVNGRTNVDGLDSFGSKLDDVTGVVRKEVRGRRSAPGGVTTTNCKEAAAGTPIRVVTGINKGLRGRRAPGSARHRRTDPSPSEKEEKETDDYRSLHDRLEEFSAVMKGAGDKKQKAALKEAIRKEAAKPKVEVKEQGKEQQVDLVKAEEGKNNKVEPQKEPQKSKWHAFVKVTQQGEKEESKDVEPKNVEETVVGIPEFVEAEKEVKPELESKLLVAKPEVEREAMCNKPEEVKENEGGHVDNVQAEGESQTVDGGQPAQTEEEKELAPKEECPVKTSAEILDSAKTCMSSLFDHKSPSAEAEQQVMDVLAGCVEAMRGEPQEDASEEGGKQTQADGGAVKNNLPRTAAVTRIPMTKCTEDMSKTTPEEEVTTKAPRNSGGLCSGKEGSSHCDHFNMEPWSLNDYLKKMKEDKAKSQTGEGDDDTLAINDLPEDLQRELVNLEAQYQYKVFPGCTFNHTSCKADALISRLNQRLNKGKSDEDSNPCEDEKKKSKFRRLKSADGQECKTRQIHKKPQNGKSEESALSAESDKPKEECECQQDSETKQVDSDNCQSKDHSECDAQSDLNDNIEPEKVDIDNNQADSSSDTEVDHDKPAFPDLNMSGLPSSLVEDLSNLKRVIALSCPQCSTRSPIRSN